MEKLRKTSGWKNPIQNGSPFWTKDSVYGVRYKCMYCSRERLGIRFGDNNYHHMKDCPWLAEQTRGDDR
jgi:hypothetical protein